MFTTEQQAAIKADILANPDLDAFPNTVDGAFGIKAAYDLVAVPDFFVYQDVSAKEVSDAIHLDEIANITSADSDRVIKFFQIRSFDGGQFHGAEQSDRDAWDDVFSAAAGDASQQAIAALWRRLATRLEALFATGTGTNGDPAIMTLQTVSYQDIYDARNS